MASELVNFLKASLKSYGELGIEQLTLSRETSKQIANSCISKSYKDIIFEDLSQFPFSLSFDASCDKYGPPYLCTYVRYVKDGEIINRMLSLDQIDDSTGLGLFNMLVERIFAGDKKAYLKNNLVGVCSDRGKKFSFNQRCWVK